MVTIATFNEPAKAKRLKERFQQAGLRADVHNEGHLQQVAFMSRPQANAKVRIEDNDFERAQELMVERPFRAQNFSQGILLRGLPLHLEQGGATRAGAPLASFLSRPRIGQSELTRSFDHLLVASGRAVENHLRYDL